MLARHLLRVSSLCLGHPETKAHVQLERLVDQAVGVPVDPLSSDSVRKALFEVLGLKVPTSRRTRTGKAKTDAEVRTVCRARTT